MNCIVIDDEPLAREGIRHLIGGCPELTLLGSFGDTDAAAAMIGTTLPDLVFLDIQMPDVNGLEFARTIPRGTLVIFTTAYSEYAPESYELDAIDYLIKPIRPERFRKAVDKAVHYLQLLHAAAAVADTPAIEKDYIYIRANGRHNKINFEDLHFIEGLKDYVILHLKDRKIMTNMILKTIHQALPQQSFFRVNKSFIINARHVTGYNNSSVYIGEEEISLSNVYKTAFLEHVGV
jgi:DNA-binding LytR/AlgR family response regulator